MGQVFSKSAYDLQREASNSRYNEDYDKAIELYIQAINSTSDSDLICKLYIDCAICYARKKNLQKSHRSSRASYRNAFSSSLEGDAYEAWAHAYHVCHDSENYRKAIEKYKLAIKSINCASVALNKIKSLDVIDRFLFVVSIWRAIRKSLKRRKKH